LNRQFQSRKPIFFPRLLRMSTWCLSSFTDDHRIILSAETNCIVRNSPQSNFLATRASRSRFREEKDARGCTGACHPSTNDPLSAVDTPVRPEISQHLAIFYILGKLNEYNISAIYCISLVCISVQPSSNSAVHINNKSDTFFIFFYLSPLTPLSRLSVVNAILIEISRVLIALCVYIVK